MKVFLRIMRILSFIGMIMLYMMVLVFQVPFLKIWNTAFHVGSWTDYYFLVIVICFIAYPLLFLLSVLYLKLKGWRVYLIYGKGELSLWGLFRQNELSPFLRFLTASPITLTKANQHLKFPYSVDFGYENRKVIPHWIWVALAFLYRTFRAVAFLAVIVAGLYFITYYFAGRV